MESLIGEKIKVVSLFENGQMKLPRAYARGIFSPRFVGSEIPPKRKILRVAYSAEAAASAAKAGHPRAYARGFPRRGIKPLLFSWQNRLYKILQIAFSYSKNIGKEKIFYFSVETNGGVFELAFNREKFSWELVKAY